MRYSVLFLFLLISSCYSPYKNLSKTEYSLTNIKQIPYTLPHSEKTLIYKANINFYNNEISGLLIIKKTGNNIYRIALTTQFGLKLFDFELNNGILIVKYCIEHLNKKIIINTFQNNFNLLLMQNRVESVFAIKNPEQNQKIWQLKSGNLSYNYIQNTKSGKIENIKFKKGNSKKISISLYNYKNYIPQNIKFKNHNIKFKMDLLNVQ